MALFTVDVEITVDADSANDARVRVQNLIGTSFDYTTGTIHDEHGEEVEDD